MPLFTWVSSVFPCPQIALFFALIFMLKNKFSFFSYFDKLSSRLAVVRVHLITNFAAENFPFRVFLYLIILTIKIIEL